MTGQTVAALADTVVTVAGGVLVALIGGGSTLASVILNARSQSKARPVTLDPDELAILRAEILDRDHRLVKLQDECDYWRDEAMRWMPQRRRNDPEESPA